VAEQNLQGERGCAGRNVGDIVDAIMIEVGGDKVGASGETGWDDWRLL
jgi:hypothetical protein